LERGTQTHRQQRDLISLLSIFSLLSLFWKNWVGLWDRVAVYVCVCLCIPPIVYRKRLGKNPLILARQRISKNPAIVGRQRLGRNVTVTNTHATIEELLDASFSVWPMSYGRK
jgi:hypothetical protein